MPTKPGKTETVSRVIVFFDICSSSSITEELTAIDKMDVMQRLLLSLKDVLEKNRTTCRYETHKFIGDGWLLLFPEKINGRALMELFTLLSRHFEKQLRSKIVPLLQETPDILGLTFGVERGSIVKLSMMNRSEYIGRTLNVASRLQSAVSQGDPHPEYSVLMSNQTYRGFGEKLEDFNPRKVTRNLRNIRGGNRYRCVKLSLPVK